ncbi:uncharacterized protein VTP21DRAFT_8379 [Calcarisporiella thermophila]|uniref:uncharacterized protein n=1 Tax=Calcarisporiella thermophila TaxID=911321 RepID=UPI0037448BAD
MSKFWSHPVTITVAKTLKWLPVAFFFVEHGYSIATVNGRSMQPTFNPDTSLLKRDIVLLDKFSVMRRKIEVGDVVTLASPNDPKRYITKRVIADEGDLVRTLPPYPESIVRIPKGHCWVEGDETFHSRDSNTFGPVPQGLINAKVTWILWPLSRFGPVPSRTKSDRIVSRGPPVQFVEDNDSWL